MRDFRGNEIKVGSNVVYCPTSRYAGLVEAIVLEIMSGRHPYRFDSELIKVKVQPIKEAHWAAKGAANDRSSGRTVILTNLGRLMAVTDG